MKEHGKVITTTVIILTTVTIVFIGAFICAITILQQKTNAQYVPNPPYSGGGEGPPIKPFHPPSDAAHSKQQEAFNTNEPHGNSTSLK